MLIPSLARKICVKIPAIFEDEEKSLGRLFAFIYKLADRLVLDRAGCICIPSPLLLREIALRREVSPKGKVVWVPAGVDREKIENIKKQAHYRINVREEYVVGFVGLIEWWQGVDILVKAVAKIKHSLDKPIKLLIVGDGPERKRIEKLCVELDIDCHITGFVRHEEALRYLLSFDVLVVPRIRSSTTESLIPIKIIEAWALGIPVVVTKHKIYDYIGLKDGEDIVFCEPNPDDVANKILVVLTDKELRKRLSERGPRIAENYFYDRIAGRIFKVI
ncbi:glycosyltransferase family 4 protein [Thermosphaera sp.]